MCECVCVCVCVCVSMAVCKRSVFVSNVQTVVGNRFLMVNVGDESKSL